MKAWGDRGEGPSSSGLCRSRTLTQLTPSWHLQGVLWCHLYGWHLPLATCLPSCPHHPCCAPTHGSALSWKQLTGLGLDRTWSGPLRKVNVLQRSWQEATDRKAAQAGGQHCCQPRRGPPGSSSGLGSQVGTCTHPTSWPSGSVPRPGTGHGAGPQQVPALTWVLGGILGGQLQPAPSSQLGSSLRAWQGAGVAPSTGTALGGDFWPTVH